MPTIYTVIFGNDAQTSDLLIQGGSLVFGSGSKGSLIIGKEDCASSSGSCSKKDLGNIPSKYTATPVGSTVVVNKKTGIVTKDVVSAVKVKCGPFFTTSGTKKESVVTCSPEKFKDYAKSSPECKAVPNAGGDYCSGSLFVGKDGAKFTDASSWDGATPSV